MRALVVERQLTTEVKQKEELLEEQKNNTEEASKHRWGTSELKVELDYLQNQRLEELRVNAYPQGIPLNGIIFERNQTITTREFKIC
jgi:hypothetical protein